MSVARFDVTLFEVPPAEPCPMQASSRLCAAEETFL